MDFVRGFIKGQQLSDNTSSGLETIQKLVERVNSSTLLSDRRDAIRAIKSLSFKYRYEVGSLALEVLISILENDRSDNEIIAYTLETLCNIMTSEPSDEESSVQVPPDDSCGEFAEIFLAVPENIALLLSLLEEYDFHTRWPTVRLVTSLLVNRPRQCQECILINPMGVSRLMDLLSDSREVIRNDSIILLSHLTRGNSSIQKIVAYENAFPRLLSIIEEEGFCDGGLIVEDCLLLLLNLTKGNSSNQTFFKEGSFIQNLNKFVDEILNSSESKTVSTQGSSNTMYLLQLIRTLVSPSNSSQQTLSCQKVMYSCGLLERLSSMLMTSGIQAEVLAEAICTCAEIIRGNQVNQEYFGKVFAPSEPPRPVIIILLLSMINDTQPFQLRCAVLYCFECYLYKNDAAQSQVIHTLLPQSISDSNSESAGYLLCTGLFLCQEPLSSWCCSIALQHAILDSPKLKEQLLRVQLAPSVSGNQPESLMQKCCNSLSSPTSPFTTRVGMLQLLGSWLCHSETAVMHFLNNPTNVPVLISLIGGSESLELETITQGLCAFVLGLCLLYNNDQVKTFTSDSLKEIICNRVGREVFTDKISQLSKHEAYIYAAKSPQISCDTAEDAIFDYEFTRLFKNSENQIIASFDLAETENNDIDSKVTSQYKELIRGLDEEKQKLSDKVSELETSISNCKKELVKKDAVISELEDKNQLLECQIQAGNSGNLVNENFSHGVNSADCSALNKENAELKMSLTSANMSKMSLKDEQPTSIDNRVDKLLQRLKELSLLENNDDANLTKIDVLEVGIFALTNNITELQSEVVRLNTEVEKSSEIIQSTNCLSETNQSFESLKKEHEDLLVLCADQDTKLSKYKTRLRLAGEQVSSDEDSDLDEEDTSESN